MSTFLATTRVALLRGSTENALGDEIDDVGDGAIVDGLGDIPASLIEKSKRVQDPSTGTWRTVRYLRCQLPVSVGHPTTGAPLATSVQNGDRIRDNRTGYVYAIDERVQVSRTIAGTSSLTLDLRATTVAA